MLKIILLGGILFIAGSVSAQDSLQLKFEDVQRILDYPGITARAKTDSLSKAIKKNYDHQHQDLKHRL